MKKQRWEESEKRREEERWSEKDKKSEEEEEENAGARNDSNVAKHYVLGLRRVEK